MESKEENAQNIYAAMAGILPQAEEISRDEDMHEKQLLDLIVLGLNDALV